MSGLRSLVLAAMLGVTTIIGTMPMVAAASEADPPPSKAKGKGKGKGKTKGKAKGKGKGPMSARTRVTVKVVHANNTNYVDPKLENIKKNLQFTKYRGFRLLDEFRSELPVGGETSFQITPNRRMKVELISRNETAAKLRIRMFNNKGKLLDTTVSIHRNRRFLVAGPKFKDGVLVLATGVRY